METPEFDSTEQHAETDNKLAGNKLAGNKLAGNALSVAAVDASGLAATEDGRELLAYFVSCALRDDQTFSAGPGVISVYLEQSLAKGTSSTAITTSSRASQPQ